MKTIDWIFTENRSLEKELVAGFQEVLHSDSLVLGDKVKTFEDEFSKLCESSFGIGVANGTDALELALKAGGIGNGDRVCIPGLSAPATAMAVINSGAQLSVVDIEDSFYCMDPEALKRKINVDPTIKAVVGVHLYGQPCDIELRDICKKHDVLFFEDAAHAHGASTCGVRVGCIGDAAAFSFYPTKNLGALGDGGMVVTNSEEINENVIRLREYGWDESRICTQRGRNSRLDELQASFLLIKLKTLLVANAKRTDIANHYSKLLGPLKELTLPKLRANTSHAYHQYVIRTEHRDELLEFLNSKGVYCGIHYYPALHEHPEFSVDLDEFESITRAKEVSQEIISLPIHHLMKLKDADLVACHIAEFFGH